MCTESCFTLKKGPGQARCPPNGHWTWTVWELLFYVFWLDEIKDTVRDNRRSQIIARISKTVQISKIANFGPANEKKAEEPGPKIGVDFGVMLGFPIHTVNRTLLTCLIIAIFKSHSISTQQSDNKIQNPNHLHTVKEAISLTTYIYVLPINTIDRSLLGLAGISWHLLECVRNTSSQTSIKVDCVVNVTISERSLRRPLLEYVPLLALCIRNIYKL